jgi:hypothetical protein
MTEPDWKKLEHLAAEIQRQLSPRSRISHNVSVPGVDSGIERQIDVLIEDNVGQFPVRIAIECKDYKAPADVTVVDSFRGLLSDTRISKGVLVCPGGFSKSALAYARKHQIETYKPIDTDPHKWQCSVSLPTLCDFRSALIWVHISFSLPLPLMLPANTGAIVVYGRNDESLGTISELVARLWDSESFPVEPGVHREVSVSQDGPARIDNGYGQIVPIDLTATLEVSRRRFVGATPVASVKGFQDLQTGLLLTNAFQLSAFDPEKIEATWQEIGESDPPFQPTLLLRGLYCKGVA